MNHQPLSRSHWSITITHPISHHQPWLTNNNFQTWVTFIIVNHQRLSTIVNHHYHHQTFSIVATLSTLNAESPGSPCPPRLSFSTMGTGGRHREASIAERPRLPIMAMAIANALVVINELLWCWKSMKVSVGQWQFIRWWRLIIDNEFLWSTMMFNNS